MSGSWSISVGGRTYGPYTGEQLRAFAAEGRLTAESLVARVGQADFRKTADEPDLAGIFSPVSGDPAMEQDTHHERHASFGRNESHSRDGERAHIVVIADMKSGSIAKLEDEIAALGPAYAILPQVWLVRTEFSANAIRNQLIQQLGKLDMLFVIDASQDKAAWFNFGPEADARIRKVWRSEPKEHAVS